MYFQAFDWQGGAWLCIVSMCIHSHAYLNLARNIFYIYCVCVAHMYIADMQGAASLCAQHMLCNTCHSCGFNLGRVLRSGVGKNQSMNNCNILRDCVASCTTVAMRLSTCSWNCTSPCLPSAAPVPTTRVAVGPVAQLDRTDAPASNVAATRKHFHGVHVSISILQAMYCMFVVACLVICADACEAHCASLMMDMNPQLANGEALPAYHSASITLVICRSGS